ncbi:DUF6188 family protein [Actinokineospora pegani]|uniref:DUF6188 family protein n=1 Tax=Actinokineospora pegani TaxID=2654637 RepID=UPI0012E9E3D1|nr:DUF6188 family protein [Actinokineospora pegani]
MRVIERADRWSFTGLEEVDTLRFDHAVTVVVTGGPERAEIRIETRFRLAAREVWELEPDGETASLAPVLPLLRQRVARLDVLKAGALELDLVGGASLTVPVSERYEAFTVAGPGQVLLVSMPGGDVAAWTS